MLRGRSRRIIFVAVGVLAWVAPGYAADDAGARLEVVGYELLGTTVVVSVQNPAVGSQQGFLSVRVGLPQGTYAAGTVVTVPGLSTLAVSVPLPCGSTAIHVIHIGVQTLPPVATPDSEDEHKPGGGSEGGKGGRGDHDGDQITEGPDPI